MNTNVIELNNIDVEGDFFEFIPHASSLREMNENSIESTVDEEDMKNKEKELFDKKNVDAYNTLMFSKIKNAIEVLKQNPEKKYARLELHSHLSLNEETKTHFHIVHYGGTKNGSWFNRHINPTYEHVFKNLQRKLFEKGYYLLDISDPSKSFKLNIALYPEKPKWYDTPHILWHNYNKI